MGVVIVGGGGLAAELRGCGSAALGLRTRAKSKIKSKSKIKTRTKTKTETKTKTLACTDFPYRRPRSPKKIQEKEIGG
jgi:hypothetical protein